MAQELFGNILEGIRDSFRHLTNASFEMIILIAAAIALIAYFLLRR